MESFRSMGIKMQKNIMKINLSEIYILECIFSVFPDYMPAPSLATQRLIEQMSGHIRRKTPKNMDNQEKTILEVFLSFCYKKKRM